MFLLYFLAFHKFQVINIDAQAKEYIDWFDSLPIDQKLMVQGSIPYSHIDISVSDMDPSQFKQSFNGVYSQFFRHIKDRHNRHLGVKTASKLLKIMKSMSYAGVVYKITQIYDLQGNRLHDGGVLVVDGKKAQKGPIRIGEGGELIQRLRWYLESARKHPANKFEDMLSQHPLGMKAFRIEILAVCRTEKELRSTEIFWQLYFNRDAVPTGYDLNKNKLFNPRLGGYSQGFSPYYIPKWELTKFVLQGLTKGDIEKHYGAKYGVGQIGPNALSQRFFRYFGSTKIYQVRLMLLKPLLDNCFKKGLPFEATIQYLQVHGVEFYDHLGPHEQRHKLTKHAVAIYGDLRIDRTKRLDKFEAIREEYFLKPYVEYLRLSGLVDQFLPRENLPPRNLREWDLFEWSIVEILFIQDFTYKQIERVLGTENIDGYFKTRYWSILKDFYPNWSSENLRNFLKSHILSFLYCDFKNNL